MLARDIVMVACSKFLNFHLFATPFRDSSLFLFLPLTQLIIEHFVLRPATTRTRRSSVHDCSPSMPALQESEAAKERGRYRWQISVPLPRRARDSDRPLLYARRSHENARDSNEPGRGSSTPYRKIGPSSLRL